jgi:hypothetical protein
MTLSSRWADRAAKSSKTPAQWDLTAITRSSQAAGADRMLPGRRHAVKTLRARVPAASGRP